MQRVSVAALTACGWQLETDENAQVHLRDEDLNAILKPLRLGQILDFVEGLYRDFARYPEELKLGVVTLYSTESSYSDDYHTRVRLTDKERAVLYALLCAPDYQVLRDDLLRDVWGYVEGIETHTLETTIYRLRQKIERDPDQPQRLLTIPDGYKFNPY